MKETHISLAHGNGGRYMRELIEQVFARHLANPSLDVQADAAAIDPGAGELMITTDGFSVKPLEFPGGNIGSLAVHGTTNDLAVAGATPRFLSLNAFIEEGFSMELLDRIVASLAHSASELNVQVVAGDTKVLPRGEGGGIYLATTGIGVREQNTKLGLSEIRSGDRLLVSGPVGDHGIAVMLAREQFGLHGELHSDAGSVLPFTQALIGMESLRFMRDPTRGGLATVAHEIARATGRSIRMKQDGIPVRDPVHSVCEILGYDPMFLACEGRVVAVVGPEQSDEALAVWQSLPGGEQAAIFGSIEDKGDHVILMTSLGGERILEELEDDPLPRIC